LDISLEQFEQQAKEKVSAIPWVKGVDVKMTAQPAKPIIADDVPAGLKKVSNIVAVSSCKVAEHAFYLISLSWKP
jgi:hypothetical protein